MESSQSLYKVGFSKEGKDLTAPSQSRLPEKEDVVALAWQGLWRVGPVGSSLGVLKLAEVSRPAVVSRESSVVTVECGHLD